MPIKSPFPDVKIPEVSLCEFLFEGGFGERASAPAFIDGSSGASLSFQELSALVDKLAGALAHRGIRKGDVVGIFAPNTPYWPVVFHGVLRANATVTSVNSLFTAKEMATQLRDSGAKLLFTVGAFLDRAREAAKAVGLPETAIVTLDVVPGLASLRELLALDAAPPELDVGPDDIAALPYSSGTTGFAKGVMLTHRNIVANLIQVKPLFSLTAETRVLAVLPFFHIYGMNVMMNAGIFNRSTVVTMPKFDLVEFLRVVSQYKLDYVYIAPPVAVALAKHPVVDQYDLSCVKVIVSGAAPLDAQLGHAVAKRLGCVVLQGYGMTELSPVSHAIPDSQPNLDLNSVGYALPNSECKIVDPESGKEVAAGGQGELWIKGPQVMKGYLHNPEATAATIDADGYLHTGDIASVTPDGVFTIADRLKELIKYKGYQVPPAELEAVLLTHPKIADAAVIGIRDDEGEEVPKAYVVKQAAGADLTEEQVMDFVASRVAAHKKVRAVEFIEQIPKSASGKILRKDLRARQAARAT